MTYRGKEDVSASGQKIIEGLVESIDMAKLMKENEQLIDLLEDLVDEDDCHYDHHGYCQAHGWFATEPSCPHARAKAIIRPASSVSAPTPGFSQNDD